MSKQKSTEDAIFEAGSNIFMLPLYAVWAVVGGIVALIAKPLRQSPEDKLRQKGKSDE